ncbi:MAG: hypothetical protein DRN30_04110 [Thermoplasmata archaeon]|nr:MAG: hypothetical protein DRN30_04110 [Thermoplasmata archaeon]
MSYLDEENLEIYLHGVETALMAEEQLLLKAIAALDVDGADVEETAAGAPPLSEGDVDAVFVESTGGIVDITATLIDTVPSYEGAYEEIVSKFYDTPEDIAVMPHIGSVLLEESPNIVLSVLPETKSYRYIEVDKTIETSVQVGTFGTVAAIADWGTQLDATTVQYAHEGVTVTTTISEDRLAEYNRPDNHVGVGIGTCDRNGMDSDEYVTIDIEGASANKAEITLSGLGGWWVETSNHATELRITAYDTEGNLIDVQGGYKDTTDGDKYEDIFTFETDVPLGSLVLGSVGSDATFVVKNITLTATEDVTEGYWVDIEEQEVVTDPDLTTELDTLLELDPTDNVVEVPVSVNCSEEFRGECELPEVVFEHSHAENFVDVEEIFYDL